MLTAVDIAGGTVPARGVRIATTVMVVAVALVIYRSIYASGEWLKRRFADPAVEAGQGLVGVAVTVVALWLVFDTWAASPALSRGLGADGFDDTTLVRLVVTLGIFVGAYLVTRLTKRVIQAVFEGDRVSVHQREIGHHLVQVGVYSTASLLVLSLWQVPLGRLLLGAGAATIVFGLAARQTLGALLAGFVLLFSRPFEIGDWVVVGDQEGIVKDINIVTTQLRTFDDEHVMIPNDKITSVDIVNRSREGRLRVTMEMRVDYATGVERAVAALQAALDELDAAPILDSPEPAVVVKRFEPSAIILELRVWIDDPHPAHKWAARTAVANAATRRFEAEGIEIPFPKREFTSGGPDTDDSEVAVGGVDAGATLALDDADLTPEQVAAIATLVDGDGESATAEATDDAETTDDPSDAPARE